jgi:hypothetical protein
MTLNITVASEWITLQSSDFRLTASGTDKALSDCAQKQFVLHYGEWSGLLCYTGVAKWGGHDTAQWLTTLLTNAKGAQTPGQVLDRIKVAGDRWIRWVPARHQRHTFTLATYEAGHARITIAS